MSFADNAPSAFALELINETSRSVFLTGKAGTGKTTFLHGLQHKNTKNTIVVAPTGVAAINAGGVTIHSFFQLPLSPFVPMVAKDREHTGGIDKIGLISKIRMNREKTALLQKLELLIIDEVSMVRCDVLDAVDTVLRHVRRRPDKPFGGLQVLLIGDLYQLSPVIREEDWLVLKNNYEGPFFFQSKVFGQLNPTYIELNKVYRQQDEQFVRLLNKIRNNTIDADDLDRLNLRYRKNKIFNADEGVITLTTHNNKADTINGSALERLPGQVKTYHANITGEFNENSYPADVTLELKTGAQVMFIRNDSEKNRRYYNGKIGSIREMGNDSIIVECREGDGTIQLIEVKRETWRNIRYSMNKTGNQIEEVELGSFSQFPLRLAWAITIHKSQGLTFEKLIIDAGDSFAPGQVYVALSRCTSLEGIQLSSPIRAGSIKLDERINQFVREQSSQVNHEEELRIARIEYEKEILNGCFDFSAFNDLLLNLEKEIKEHMQPGEFVLEWLKRMTSASLTSRQHGQSFIKEMCGYDVMTFPRSHSELLQKRIIKASDWFSREWIQIREILLQCPLRSDNRELSRRLNDQMDELFRQANLHVHLMGELHGGFVLKKCLTSQSALTSEKCPLVIYSGKSREVPEHIANPLLFLALSEKRNELARERAMPVYLICSTQSLEQMSALLPDTEDALLRISGFGEVKLRQYGAIFLEIIQEYAMQHGLQSMMPEEMPQKKKKKNHQEPRKKNDSKEQTLTLIREGKTISDIAMLRELAISTIEGHVAHFIEIGILSVDDFVEKKQQQIIRQALQKNPEIKALGKLKEILPECSYCEIRMLLADETLRNTVKGVTV